MMALCSEQDFGSAKHKEPALSVGPPSKATSGF